MFDKRLDVFNMLKLSHRLRYQRDIWHVS